jgi:hypothetical protein
MSASKLKLLSLAIVVAASVIYVAPQITQLFPQPVAVTKPKVPPLTDDDYVNSVIDKLVTDSRPPQKQDEIKLEWKRDLNKFVIKFDQTGSNVLMGTLHTNFMHQAQGNRIGQMEWKNDNLFCTTRYTNTSNGTLPTPCELAVQIDPSLEMHYVNKVATLFQVSYLYFNGRPYQNDYHMVIGLTVPFQPQFDELKRLKIKELVCHETKNYCVLSIRLKHMYPQVKILARPTPNPTHTPTINENIELRKASIISKHIMEIKEPRDSIKIHWEPQQNRFLMTFSEVISNSLHRSLQTFAGNLSYFPELIKHWKWQAGLLVCYTIGQDNKFTCELPVKISDPAQQEIYKSKSTVEFPVHFSIPIQSESNGNEFHMTLGIQIMDKNKFMELTKLRLDEFLCHDQSPVCILRLHFKELTAVPKSNPDVQK